MADKHFKDIIYQSGKTIAKRYQLIEVIGQGALGIVLRVDDNELDRDIVVLKILHRHLLLDQSAVLHFHQEVSTCRQLSHPNIVRIYDLIEDEEEEISFISMECVHGPNLREYLDIHKGNRISREDAFKILNHTARGLAFAHKKQILHRDIKPSNILLDTDGIAKLSDFGLAQSLQQTHGLTATGESLGTPAYMSPEHFLGKGIDAQSDIYSLGIVAYEIMCGQLPFLGTDYYSLAKQHLNEPPSIEPLEHAQLSPWCITLIKRCIAKNKKDRFHNCDELIKYIRENASQTLENPRVDLKHYTRRALRTRYFSNRFLYTFRALMALLLLAVFIGTAREQAPRARTFSAVMKTEKALTTKLYPIRTLLRLPHYTTLSLESFKSAVKKKDILSINAILVSNVEFPPDSHQETIIHYAAKDKHQIALPSIFKFSKNINLNAQNKDGNTALHLSLIHSLKANVHILINKPRINFNLKNNQGNTPFHTAVTFSTFTIQAALLKHARNKIIDWRMNKAGQTPLHIAVTKRKDSMVRLLLRFHNNPNVQDANGRTPLMLALQQLDGSDERVQTNCMALIRAGASLRSRDYRGRSIQDYAKSITAINFLSKAMDSLSLKTKNASPNKSMKKQK